MNDFTLQELFVMSKHIARSSTILAKAMTEKLDASKMTLNQLIETSPEYKEMHDEFIMTINIISRIAGMINDLDV